MGRGLQEIQVREGRQTCTAKKRSAYAPFQRVGCEFKKISKISASCCQIDPKNQDNIPMEVLDESLSMCSFASKRHAIDDLIYS